MEEAQSGMHPWNDNRISEWTCRRQEESALLHNVVILPLWHMGRLI